MRTFLVLLSLNLLVLTMAETQQSICQIPNTGTVLFRNIDLHRKHCWSKEEMALLYTRRAMMKLIPKQVPHNIPLILEHIRICLTTLKEKTSSKEVYDYMFAALADTFGGYLQTYGLPILNEAYYEGYISYDNANDFYQVQNNFKGILMTNGKGWTKPSQITKHINRVLPLKLPTINNNKHCNLLLSDNDSQKYLSDAAGDQSKTHVPLPILDDYTEPNSIAIPFKNHVLYNIRSRSSYDILIKYYIEATRCLKQMHKTSLEQSEFDHEFSTWLKAKVIPHLNDETWYVGFSNVLRIEETIQQRSGMVAASQSLEREEESVFAELDSQAQFTYVTYIVVFAILLLSILFICFLHWGFIQHCLMCCRRSDKESSSGGSSGSDKISLLSGSEYTNSTRGGMCRHDHSHFHSDSHYSPRSCKTTQEDKLTMSCGMGRGFLPTCRRQHH